MSSGGSAGAKANAMGAAISAGAKKLFTKENKEKASKALADSKAIAMKHHEELKAAGFYDKFGHFNQELVKPMTEYGGDVEKLKGEMRKTFMFQSDNPHLSFLICNSTCFFVGALGGVWSVVCGDYFGAIWNLFISYMLAYWFYFAFIVNKEKYATCSMAVLALYVGYTAFSVIGNLIFIIPPVIYGVKAVCGLAMLWYGYQVSKGGAAPGQGGGGGKGGGKTDLL